MGEKTGISWCDHTFNPWIGCTKVSAGCQNCYAERDNTRYQWVKEWGKDYRLTSDANWNKPIQWAKNAVKDGVTRRVFCASLADVFDEKVPESWVARLHTLIWDTADIGGLEWLILTKRPENIEERFPQTWIADPPKNVRIGATCENQEMTELRLQRLFTNWQGKNFISVEPTLSEINLKQNSIDYLDGWYTDTIVDPNTGEPEPCQAPMPKVNWVICGGESGPNARPIHPDWVRTLRDQCQAAGVPFFFKQWGEWREKECKETKEWASKTYYTGNQVMSIGNDQFFRIGKKNAGNLLDGKVWAQFPGG